VSFLADIEKWAQGFEAYIDKQVATLTSSIRTAERELLRVVLRDFLPALDVKDGKITATLANRAKLRILDRALQRFQAGPLRELVKQFTAQLLEAAGRNASYYLIAGFDLKKVENLSVSLDTKGA